MEISANFTSPSSYIVWMHVSPVQTAAAYAAVGAAEDPEGARQWALTIDTVEMRASILKQLDEVR